MINVHKNRAMGYVNMCLDLHKNLGELSPTVKFLLAVLRRCFFCGFFCYLCFMFVFPLLSCLFLQPCGSLVCNVFLCFVSFPYGVLGRVWYLIV